MGNLFYIKYQNTSQMLTNLYGSSHSYLQELSAANNSMLYQPDTVTLYQVGPKGCGQTVLQKNNTAPAMVFDPLLKVGTCASEGYTVPHGSVVHKVPIFDKFATIVIDEFVKPAALQELLFDGEELMELGYTDLYQIGPDGCGQTHTFNSNVAPTLAYSPTLKRGTCASQGYPQFNGYETISLPEGGYGSVI